MIIFCKETKKNNTVEKYPFFTVAIGRDNLVTDHIYHELFQNKETFWLCFETFDTNGKFSRRDGSHL